MTGTPLKSNRSVAHSDCVRLLILGEQIVQIRRCVCRGITFQKMGDINFMVGDFCHVSMFLKVLRYLLIKLKNNFKEEHTDI